MQLLKQNEKKINLSFLLASVEMETFAQQISRETVLSLALLHHRPPVRFLRIMNTFEKEETQAQITVNPN